MRNYKLERLQNGETFTISEKGNSMTPLIKSGQEHVLVPAKWKDCNKGKINGWTKNIYGLVTEVK